MIPAPVPEPNPIAETLKANTKALNDLKGEVADLKTSAASKEELKKALTAMETQTSAITKMKDDIITKAGKYVYDISTAGYTDTSKLKEDIKALVDRAL